jgi:lanosterol synthase
MQPGNRLRSTEPARWRLGTNAEGVHLWHYLSEEAAKSERPQTYAEKYFLGLPRVIRV